MLRLFCGMWHGERWRKRDSVFTAGLRSAFYARRVHYRVCYYDDRCPYQCTRVRVASTARKKVGTADDGSHIDGALYGFTVCLSPLVLHRIRLYC